jgi:hypothetical protein
MESNIRKEKVCWLDRLVVRVDVSGNNKALGWFGLVWLFYLEERKECWWRHDSNEKGRRGTKAKNWMKAMKRRHHTLIQFLSSCPTNPDS